MGSNPVTNHSSSGSGRPLYDVFLSFRGADTRHTFTKFLYMELTGARFKVFIDDKDLEKGKNIDDELIEAINHSRISIPIISKDYASSESCLMELVNMLKRKDDKNHIVIPIFYFVDPSDVGQCDGPFARPFLGCNHSRSDCWKFLLKWIHSIGPFAASSLGRKDGCNHSHVDDTDIGSWESALKRIANMGGHHLNEMNAVDHMNIIKRIIRDVRQKLKKENLIEPKRLVVVDHHVQSIMEMLKVDYHDGRAVTIDETLTKVLVISGITGVGKTVLAKYVYNKLCHLYDYCSFCGQIQAETEHGKIVSVQNKLISDLLKGNALKFDCSDKAMIHIQHGFRNMKVLLFLDDVKDQEQLSALVGELDWLGPGSRVIVTSQRADVLRNVNGVESFVLEPMERDESLKLFCRYAFGTDSPSEKFKELSKKIVDATGRLPYLLKLVGSSLSLVKREREWNETLESLQAVKGGLNERVQAALKKSYTNLNEKQQQIFLDIACFFTGEDMRIPYYMWNDYNFCPSESIRALDAWSFVKIGEDKEICMHEILKKFGREIVKNENRDEPWKRSRLCDHEEALHVLTEGKGTGQVKALRLEFGDGSVGHSSFEYDQFKNLQNLTYLKLDRAGIRGNFEKCFSMLRWLDWQGAPRTFDDQLQILNLQKLVILDLSGSQVDKDWRGWDLLEKARKLKVLKLTDCFQLIDTPKFPHSMELERLILEGCSKLAVINPSSGYLDKLVSLNLKQCCRLDKLPNLGPMKHLKELVIDGTTISEIHFQGGSIKMLKTLSARNCKKLKEISDSFRYLKSLKHLALDSTAIKTCWDSIGSLEKLKRLSLKDCRGLTHLPNEIGKLKSLQFLDLSGTTIRDLPLIEEWKALKELRVRGTFIEKFPEAILKLNKLEEIDFSSCGSLTGEIPNDIWRMSSLAILKLSDTRISGLPPSISCLSRLRELHILRCYHLPSLPELPSLVKVFRDSDI